MTDLIYRQAAIDAVNRYDFKYPKYMERFVTELRDAMKADITDDLEDLPSAQPEITLESAIDYLHSIGWMQEHDKALTERKTGRWIHDGRIFPHGTDWIHCSVCGQRGINVPADLTNFCPNCGAKMEVEDG